jgi:hypothetical protein
MISGLSPRTTVAGMAAVLLAAAAYPAIHTASAATPPKATCASLAGRTIAASRIRLPTSGGKITSAKLVSSEGQPGTPDYVPEYCDVRGEIAPADPKAGTINFGVAMPTAWNGKAMQIGGNGMLGFVPWLAALNRNGAGSPSGATYPPNVPYPIARGYATYGGDSGHKVGSGNGPGAPGGVPPSTGQATVGGAPPPPPSYDWAANRETWLNFTYQHVRKDHDAAMAVIEMMYGAKPKLNYFLGESHGGRQSVEAIAHYGEDYNGVLISVPLSYLTELWLYDMRNLKAQAAPGGWIPATKLPVIEAETIRQCDALDGLKDGVVLNYAACTKAFDPALHPDAMAAVRCPDGSDGGAQCLSDAQIRTVNAIRSPLRLSYAIPGGAKVYPGSPVGAEATLNWPAQRNQPDPANLNNGFIPLLRILLDEPTLTVANLDIDRLGPKLQKVSEELDAPTDWSPYLARGGKVIFHTASDDYTTNANGQIALYQAVAKQAGKAATDRGLRYYVTPSADHGSKSLSFPDKAPQPRQMDLVGLLTDWVEAGKVPPSAVRQDLMETSAPYTVSRSRPLCLYPNYPRYIGSGDTKLMASYRCAAP